MRSNVEIITANHKTYNYFITIQVMEPVDVAERERESMSKWLSNREWTAR